MSQKNYTDKDHETVARELWRLKKDSDSVRALAALEALDNAGRIAPPWEPCERDEIKKGDRVRVELGVSKTVEEYTAVDDHSFDNSSRSARWFRIPAPAPAVEWPTERGLYDVTYLTGYTTRAALLTEGDDHMVESHGTIEQANHLGLIANIKKVGANE